MEDAKNRTKRNNIRLKGIPEATLGADLLASVVAIFNQLLGDPPSNVIEINPVYRVPVMRDVSLTAPQDVLCCVHFFTIKEAIMRAARQKGPLDFDEAQVHLFLDLCHHTLYR